MSDSRAVRGWYGRGLALIVAAVLLTLFLAGGADAAPAPQGASAFEPAPCPFPLVPGELGILGDVLTQTGRIVEGRDVQCGYLTVPAHHADPNGPTIRLAVAVIKSTNASPAPDPLVMLQGGPGGSTIDTYASLFLLNLLPDVNKIRAERDIVLFDQRGTLYSQPALLCQEDFDLVDQTIEQRLSREEAARLQADSALACRDRLAGEGVDLTAYNSLENAADIDTLRRALGYDKINLYGVSYGTLLALHAMRAYPDSLRSVVLDSVVPPQVNFLLDQPSSQQRAFDELFQACAADAACNAAYPDLRQVFYDTLDKLNESPARVAVTDPTTGRTYDAVVDGDTFSSILFQLMYPSELLGALPKMIHDASEGRFTLPAQVWPLLLFDRTMATGMYFSVVCAEDGNFRVEDAQLDKLPPEIAAPQESQLRSILDVCQGWKAPPLPPAALAPVVSEVPTLLLSGRFDPITPPSYAAAAASSLRQPYRYTFPWGGHGAFSSNTCATRLVQSFLSDPTAPPDASCVEAQSAPKFVTPDQVVDSPGVAAVMRPLGNLSVRRMALPLALILVLQSVILVWPASWIVNRLRRRGKGQPWLARLAPWLAALLGILAGLFVEGVQVATVLSERSVILFGLPPSAGWLLWLPLLVAVLTVVLAVLAVAAWTRRWWGRPRRVYFTVLALAAIGVVSSFATVNVLWK
ncbi:MAG: alpha/beta fold hydrolase [Anaerolineae bacterium]